MKTNKNCPKFYINNETEADGGGVAVASPAQQLPATPSSSSALGGEIL
jgi:hypothetical protein